MNALSEPLWEYKSGFQESDNFDPYVGYYFFNRTRLASIRIPYDLYLSPVFDCPGKNTASWRVDIALSSNEIVDKAASLGVAKEASRGLDRLDFRKPRAIATTPSISFYRPEWDVNYSTFATDIRPEFEESESWEFEVTAKQQEASQLAFSGIKHIPPHFEVYLIDEGRSRSLNLREDSLYQFTPTAGLSKFSVVVGKKDAVQEKLAGLSLPTEFIIGPNYPNPFNPETTIPIAIPATSEIKLKVYNILGEETATLYDGYIEAGRYWFSWDGRNYSGNDLATGVYFYRLTTSTGISTASKMILIR